MSETSFPVNDLIRRRFQTSLIVTSFTLSVGSTLFLLLFGDRIGFRVSSMAGGSLTVGILRVFSPLTTFIGLLTVLSGAVIVSFMVYMMMRQRMRDVGLMKATGCRNDLIFGYFMTEMLVITFVSCVLGTVLGLVADYAAMSMFGSLGFGNLQKSVNSWMVLLVFGVFFALALIFGAKPVFDAIRVEPVKAMSRMYQFGVSKEPGFTVVSKSGFTTKIALRSLFRRRSATIRIVVCLSAVFVLLTVAVAGGVIAGQTTKSWVRGASGEDVVLIAHGEMCNQYRFLLSKFHGAEGELHSGFDYMDEKYLISEEVVDRLSSMSQVAGFERRLVLEEYVEEVPGYIFEEDTAGTVSVGDHRNGTSLIVGVEPGKVLNRWFMEGRFLGVGDRWRAVIGDSLSYRMFSVPLNQSISVAGTFFEVVGVCLDPINNGNVTYVPLETLEKKAGRSGANIILVVVDPAADREYVLDQMQEEIRALSPGLDVSDLNVVLERNLDFLESLWSMLMFLPLFSVVSASLCLIGYVMLSIDEQRREFGVLRAVGLKPKTVLKILSEQSFVVLLSSFGVGIPIGVIVTLLILMPEPVVTGFTILEIAGWLTVSLAVLFISSLYPAVRFGRKSILDVMNQP